MSNPRSTLVAAFQDNYVEDMAADEEQATTIPSAEQALEEIEAFLRIGWEGNATDRIAAFERKYGIDFEELTAEVAGLEDPR